MPSISRRSGWTTFPRRSPWLVRPTNIRRGLQLNKPIYQRTASYGHFGRKPERDGAFSWERTDLVTELKRAFGAR